MNRDAHSLAFALHIDADAYLKRYRTPNAVVSIVSDDGRRVRFPANILQRFVTHTGISGRFRIYFDGQGKFLRIERIE
ncbi:MAG: DUF2835 domain-containing protein [Spongiibacteraceae bacterium]|jgi:hypothetical protein|nr:DUF2835 domain-containing protein [Spongiibacteraceae bacterium]